MVYDCRDREDEAMSFESEVYTHSEGDGWSKTKSLRLVQQDCEGK